MARGQLNRGSKSDMAESNNFSEINDNFDTIKTLLNSIRAQGILNTSDVDKLLEGMKDAET